MQRIPEKILSSTILLIATTGTFIIGFVVVHRSIKWPYIVFLILSAVIFIIAVARVAKYLALRKKQFDESQYINKVINSIQDGIISTDEQYVIKSWNRGAEQIYGWTAAEAIGKCVDEVIPTDFPQAVLEEARSEFLRKGYFNQELVRYTRSGKKLQILVSSSALYDKDGKFTGLVSINKDITQRKELEEQLIQANKALEEKYIVQQTKLNSVFERITDAFLAIDKNWRFTYINQKTAEIMGKDPADLIGTNIWDEFEHEGDKTEHPFYKAAHKAMNEQVYVSSESYYAPYQRWFENHFYPSAEGLSLFFRDITDKKMAEKHIHDSEAKRRLIMNAALDAIICIDTQGCITFWNPQAEKIFGWRVEEVLGHSLADIIIPLPFRARHTSGMANYMKTGQGPALNVLLELSAINRDGNEFPIELTVLPIKQDGEEFFCAFIRDITNRKRSEEAIKNSELRFRSLIEKGMELIAMHDENGKIIYMSPSIKKILGYDPEDRIGRAALDAVHPDDVPRIKKILAHLIANPGLGANAQWRHQHADGSWHWMEGVATNLLHDPAVRAVVHNFRDISDREKIESELVEKNSELQRLSAYLQHVREEERKYIAREVHDELGQLVSALKIDIDWMGLRFAPLEQPAQKRMDHAAKTIEILISSIRKIASSLRPSILDDFGLNAAMEWQCREMRNLNGIPCSFVSLFDDKGLDIEVKTELFRIAQESLTNVMRHSEAKNVTVELSENDENIYLKISDDGKGFDVRQKSNTLGLVGLRERAVSLHGSLNIASEPGKGTVVFVCIPKNKIQ